MDVTGIGDVVYPTLKKLVPITYSILYTSGNNSESEADRRTYPGSTHFKTAKSLLVQRLMSFVDENQIDIYQYTNQELLKEISHLTRKVGTLGQVTFDSSYSDDVFNSFMLAVYAVYKK